jgi:hypothetical protein
MIKCQYQTKVLDRRSPSSSFPYHQVAQAGLRMKKVPEHEHNWNGQDSRYAKQHYSQLNHSSRGGASQDIEIFSIVKAS